MPNEITTAKPKVAQEIYFKQDKFLTMSYQQKESQNKSATMMLKFCGAFDVPYHKKEDKVAHAMVDLYNQNLESDDLSHQVMYYYAFEQKSKSWSKEVAFNLLTCLLMNSINFIE